MGVLPNLLGYLAVAILLHSIICHLVTRGTAFLKFLIAGVIVGVYLMISAFSTYGLQLESFALIFGYAFCCELYIFLFTFIASSISVSLLLRIGAGNKRITELAQHYTGKAMVENRLRRLQKINLLTMRGDELHATAQGMQLVNKFLMLRRFFNLPPIISSGVAT